MIMDRVKDCPDGPKPVTSWVAASIAVGAGLLRLVPHPWNFSPTYAMEIFCGARLRSWQSLAIPLGIRVATDLLLLPVYGTAILSPLIYLSVLVNVLLGKTLCSTGSAWRIGAVAILASEQFFFISNLSSWIELYPHTLQGLVTCYAMAIPFFAGTLLSTVLYCGVLFGAYAWLTRKQPELPRAGLAVEPV